MLGLKWLIKTNVPLSGLRIKKIEVFWGSKQLLPVILAMIGASFPDFLESKL